MMEMGSRRIEFQFPIAVQLKGNREAPPRAPRLSCCSYPINRTASLLPGNLPTGKVAVVCVQTAAAWQQVGPSGRQSRLRRSATSFLRE